jgi:hypothetical protein
MIPSAHILSALKLCIYSQPKVALLFSEVRDLPRVKGNNYRASRATIDTKYITAWQVSVCKVMR